MCVDKLIVFGFVEDPISEFVESVSVSAAYLISIQNFDYVYMDSIRDLYRHSWKHVHPQRSGTQTQLQYFINHQSKSQIFIGSD